MMKGGSEGLQKAGMLPSPASTSFEARAGEQLGKSNMMRYAHTPPISALANL